MDSRIFIFSTTLVTSLLYAVTAISNPDGLTQNAPNVCVNKEETKYYVSETFREAYQVKTYTWCFSIPPRCSEWHTKYRIGTRAVLKSRYTETLVCCSGFKPDVINGEKHCLHSETEFGEYGPRIGSQCVSNCNNHGTCVAPNICNCHHGYIGRFCEASCTVGYWGKDCTQTCSCASNITCDPSTGQCVCPPGYQQPTCAYPCVNSFGQDCKYTCACQNGATCYHVTGACMCQPNFYGVYCHLACVPGSSENSCSTGCLCQKGDCVAGYNGCVCHPGYKGTYCNENCDPNHWGPGCVMNCTCHNGHCNPLSGICTCKPGYYGTSCQNQCDPSYYGTSCENKCHCEFGGQCVLDLNNKVVCDCEGTGFKGPNCSQSVCSYLKFGDDCSKDCPCSVANTKLCHSKTGKCICKPGYTGSNCSQKCSAPYYGDKCKQVCTCDHGTCNHVTGVCDKCHPGYTGVRCTEECTEGRWGQNCTNVCQCANNADCRHTTGYCNCTAGYKGLYCNAVCSPGTYGYNCTGHCPCTDPEQAECSPFTGECHCKQGYTGVTCDTACEEGMFGFNCQYKCACDMKNTESCDHKTGICKCQLGWRGVECTSSCPFGSWGKGCSKSCSCNNQGSCDQQTGACVCRPGYRFPYCAEKCPEGSFGQGCKETCECASTESCNHVTGACSGACPPGFHGVNCETLCPSGTWGPGCANQCHPECTIPKGICNPVNGACGCLPGFLGKNCVTSCVPGYYGVKCAYKCPCRMSTTKDCDPIRGFCTCKPGYRGDFCELAGSDGKTGKQEGTPEETGTNAVDGTVIGLAIGLAALVLIIIAGIVCYRRRVKKLKEDNLEVRFSNMNGHAQTETGLGMVNPTYDDQNLNNDQRRFPNLNRTVLPPPDYSGRPTSCSSDVCENDEDRYATLKSLGSPGSRGVSEHDYNITPGACGTKLEDKYMLYKGQKTPNQRADEERRTHRPADNMPATLTSNYKPNNLQLAVSEPIYDEGRSDSNCTEDTAAMNLKAAMKEMPQTTVLHVDLNSQSHYDVPRSTPVSDVTLLNANTTEARA